MEPIKDVFHFTLSITSSADVPSGKRTSRKIAWGIVWDCQTIITITTQQLLYSKKSTYYYVQRYSILVLHLLVDISLVTVAQTDYHRAKLHVKRKPVTG